MQGTARLMAMMDNSDGVSMAGKGFIGIGMSANRVKTSIRLV
jgi:hypothetical protein